MVSGRSVCIAVVVVKIYGVSVSVGARNSPCSRRGGAATRPGSGDGAHQFSDGCGWRAGGVGSCRVAAADARCVTDVWQQPTARTLDRSLRGRGEAPADGRGESGGAPQHSVTSLSAAVAMHVTMLAFFV